MEKWDRQAVYSGLAYSRGLGPDRREQLLSSDETERMRQKMDAIMATSGRLVKEFRSTPYDSIRAA
jgi:hypothetical protein